MDLKRRIERLEKERQPAVPVQPPKIYKVQEISVEEWNATYAKEILEYCLRKPRPLDGSDGST